MQFKNGTEGAPVLQLGQESAKPDVHMFRSLLDKLSTEGHSLGPLSIGDVRFYIVLERADAVRALLNLLQGLNTERLCMAIAGTAGELPPVMLGGEHAGEALPASLDRSEQHRETLARLLVAEASTGAPWGESFFRDLKSGLEAEHKEAMRETIQLAGRHVAELVESALASDYQLFLHEAKAEIQRLQDEVHRLSALAQQPAAEEPSSQPAAEEPSSQPAAEEPSSQPAEPSSQPAEPSSQPAEPSSQPGPAGA